MAHAKTDVIHFLSEAGFAVSCADIAGDAWALGPSLNHWGARRPARSRFRSPGPGVVRTILQGKATRQCTPLQAWSPEPEARENDRHPAGMVHPPPPPSPLPQGAARGVPVWSLGPCAPAVPLAGPVPTPARPPPLKERGGSGSSGRRQLVCAQRVAAWSSTPTPR